MGRRKRKQVVYRPVKRLPKIFKCPACGKKTMKTSVDKDKKHAKVICGSCGKEQEVKAIGDLTEPVDVFGEFIDIYYAEQEYERLRKRAEKLEKKKQYSELAMVYSYLSDICKINAEEAMKEYYKSNEEEDLKNAQMWQAQADEYKKLSKDVFEKLKLKELEDGIEDESIYEDAEDSEFIYDTDSQTPRTSSGKIKRGRSLEDIVDDPGFLEF